MRFLLAAALYAAAFSLYAFTLKDDLGRTVTLPHSAKRMIILSPDGVETAFAMGAEKQIVGVVLGSDYPEEAKRLPVVGSASGLDLERIAAFSPDLIIIWGASFLPSLKPLIEAGVPVYVYYPKHLSDVIHEFHQFGKLSGHQKAGEILAHQFEKILKQAKVMALAHPKRRVFFELNAKPLMTVNGDDWISDVISICGGENIFANLSVSAPVVDPEAVVALHPDMILKTTPETLSFLRQKTITLSPDIIERPGPRLLRGIHAVCREFI